ncbi:MAG: hypothetical protein CMF17_11810 [Idiomarinaceae bacterium]|nr:hypothetical protein [Idiomarinaceae bacterium]
MSNHTALYSKQELRDSMEELGIQASSEEIITEDDVRSMAIAMFKLGIRDQRSDRVRQALLDLEVSGSLTFREDLCDACEGSGFRGVVYGEPQKCETCRGLGHV